jgi:uncharacterized DUF497 family protein
MEFEWDAAKGASNAEKHGIAFETAQALWADPALLVVPARTTDEPRWLAVGRIAGRHWSAIFTWRDDRIRLISVRAARKEEIAAYESA